MGLPGRSWSGPVAFIAAQLAVVLVAWAALERSGCTCTCGDGGGSGFLRLPLFSWQRQQGLQPPLPPKRPPQLRPKPVTSNLSYYESNSSNYVFEAPQSGCRLLPTGTVLLPQGWDSVSTPFLFDTASMPSKEESGCFQGPPGVWPPLLCGPCQFEERLCDAYFPGQNQSAAMAQQFMASGHNLWAFSPCELFARIRGRTLWFMGDSQSFHWFYSLDCFLREFAPSFRRTPAVQPESENLKLNMVNWNQPPMCLDLVDHTRVCIVRVDTASEMQHKVLPRLIELVPAFHKDLMVFNTGLHYPFPPNPDEAPNSTYVHELQDLAVFRQEHAHRLPQMIWMDVPPQHFDAPGGDYPGRADRYTCKPLLPGGGTDSFEDSLTRAGGRYNIAVAPLVPQLADAHLRIWNVTLPLWDTHKPGECSHWCSPGAYHLWLYLLNDVLRDSELGNPVEVPDRAAAAAQGAT